MKAHFKYIKPNYPNIVEIDINPEIFMKKENRSIPIDKREKSKLLHKKINSANNQSSKLRDNKKLNFSVQNSNESNSSIQTPEINSKYKLRLERLNTNISSLRNKYADLLKENIDYNNRDNSLKLNFLKIKRDEQQKEMYRKKQQYIIVKNTKLKEEQEKNQKIKEEYQENKKKEFLKKQIEVKKLKNKEINDYQNHKKRMLNYQTYKKKLKEQEKDFIEKKLKEQESKNISEMEKRKMINKEKQKKKDERMLENKVHSLEKIMKDLVSKVKIQKNINKKMNRDYYLTFKTTINDENVKNSD